MVSGLWHKRSPRTGGHQRDRGAHPIERRANEAKSKRYDLRQHGIRVSLVCPGGVDTGLTRTVRIAGIDKSSPRFQKALARFRSHAVSPDQAATAILKGMRRGRYWIYTSFDIRAIHMLQRHAEPAYVLAMRVLNYGANRALPEVEAARKQELT